jgi:hypothetical protein
MTKVDFELKGYGRSNRIMIPPEAKCLFPYHYSFDLNSSAGSDKVIVEAHPGDLHIHLTKTKWFKNNKHLLKNGYHLMIEITESKEVKQYYLK